MSDSQSGKREPQGGVERRSDVSSEDFVKIPPTEDGGASNVESQTLRVLGDYRLLDEIGRGGMGVVYVAEQISLGRKVALKILPPHATASAKHIERFRHEARSVAKLKHPGIVPIHAVGEALGCHFFAMDLVEGENLADWIVRNPNRYDKEHYRFIAKAAAQIARALHYAHREGIVHRDIKPQNILLDQDRRPMLVDFGLAKDVGQCTLSMTGEIAGTPYYMSPEQLLAKRVRLDHRTDIFSLGVVLYELLTSQRPFEGTTSQQLLYAISFKDPAPLRVRDRGIPRDLETICLKALSKDPDDRYATAAEMAEDLQCHLNDEPIRARPVGALSRVIKRVRREPALRAALVTTVLCTIVFGISLGLLVTNGSSTDESISGKDSRRPLQDLLAELTSDAPQERRRAADDIIAYRSEAIPGLEALLDHDDASVRDLAARLLVWAPAGVARAEQEWAEDLALILEVTDDPAPLMAALARRGAAAIPSVVDFIARREPLVGPMWQKVLGIERPSPLFDSAAAALRKLGRTSVKPLAHRIRGSDALASERLLWVLGTMGGDAHEVLEDLFARRLPDATRGMIAVAMIEAQYPSSIEAVRSVLASEDLEGRSLLLGALCQIDVEVLERLGDFAPLVAPLLEDVRPVDSTRRVCDLAGNALHLLFGDTRTYPLGTRPDVIGWKVWWEKHKVDLARVPELPNRLELDPLPSWALGPSGNWPGVVASSPASSRETFAPEHERTRLLAMAKEELIADIRPRLKTMIQRIQARLDERFPRKDEGDGAGLPSVNGIVEDLVSILGDTVAESVSYEDPSAGIVYLQGYLMADPFREGTDDSELLEVFREPIDRLYERYSLSEVPPKGLDDVVLEVFGDRTIYRTAMPDWMRAPNYGLERDPNAFFAVGVAHNVASPILGYRISLAMAQRELVSIFHFHTQKMFATYMREAADAEDGVPLDSQLSDRVSLAIAELLIEPQVEKTFVDRDGSYYTLVRASHDRSFVADYRLRANRALRQKFEEIADEKTLEALKRLDAALEDNTGETQK